MDIYDLSGHEKAYEIIFNYEKPQAVERAKNYVEHIKTLAEYIKQLEELISANNAVNYIKDGNVKIVEEIMSVLFRHGYLSGPQG